MAAYLRYVEVLKGAVAAFELVHVPKEQNARADLLAKLASSGKGGRQRTIIQETGWMFFTLAQQEESQGAITL